MAFVFNRIGTWEPGNRFGMACFGHVHNTVTQSTPSARKCGRTEKSMNEASVVSIPVSYLPNQCSLSLTYSTQLSHAHVQHPS
jgi:hypothetical protein